MAFVPMERLRYSHYSQPVKNVYVRTGRGMWGLIEYLKNKHYFGTERRYEREAAGVFSVSSSIPPMNLKNYFR